MSALDEKRGLCVVATTINPDGETDSLFLEPAHDIDDGCVALTRPYPRLRAIWVLRKMQARRNKERREAAQ